MTHTLTHSLTALTFTARWAERRYRAKPPHARAALPSSPLRPEWEPAAQHVVKRVKNNSNGGRNVERSEFVRSRLQGESGAERGVEWSGRRQPAAIAQSNGQFDCFSFQATSGSFIQLKPACAAALVLDCSSAALPCAASHCHCPHLLYALLWGCCSTVCQRTVYRAMLCSVPTRRRLLYSM